MPDTFVDFAAHAGDVRVWPGTGASMSDSVSDTVSTLLREDVDGVRILTLNRPTVRNAIDLDLRASLVAELAALDGSDDIGAVIITGTDPAFCAGVDFAALARSRADGPPSGPNPAAAIRAVDQPVIAAVNGACVTGGLEIALSCDFIVASERAFFADTHAQYGLYPGKGMWGMSALLPEAVGIRQAKELSLTGRRISASDAVAGHFVNKVVAHDELRAVALQTAQQIARIPPRVRRAWVHVYDSGRGATWPERLEIEHSHVEPEETP